MKIGTVSSRDLFDSGDLTAETHLQTIDHDDLWPRDAEHRYRVYGRIGRQLTVLFACPEPGGIGQGLVAFHEDAKKCDPPRRLADHGQIGVLDVIDRDWIVLPWSRPEGKVTFGKPPLEVVGS